MLPSPTRVVLLALLLVLPSLINASSTFTNNWAVLVCTVRPLHLLHYPLYSLTNPFLPQSRFWFNYRVRHFPLFFPSLPLY
jgi:glycosylphosphatidylinositol transamidase (GPIT) subunit GPI8